MADNLIQVGAVFDGAQLNAAVNEATANVQKQLQQMSAAFAKLQAQSAASIAALEARVAELEASIATHSKRSSEALHSIALAGEDLGITVNRHVRGIIAGMPALAAAFEAAFPIFGAIALFDVLKSIPEKLKEVIEGLDGLSEEEKKYYADAIESAKKLEQVQEAQVRGEYELQIARAKGEIDKQALRVLEAAALTKINQDFLGELNKQKSRFDDLINANRQLAVESQKQLDNISGTTEAILGGIVPGTAEAKAEAVEASKEYKELGFAIAEAQAAVDSATARQITAQHALTNEYKKASDSREAAEKKIQDIIFATLQQTTALQRQAIRTQTEDLLKAAEEQNKAQIQAGQEAIRVFEIQQEAAKAHAEAQGEIDLQRLDFERRIGRLSEADYERQLQQRLAQTYAESRQELEDKLASEREGTAEHARTLAELQKLDDKYRIDSERLEQQSLIRRRQRFDQYFHQVSGEFNSALNSWIQGTQTAGQAFAQMFDSILVDLIGFIEQWIERKVELWLLDAILGKGAAVNQATQSAAVGLSQVEIDANVAAANAYAAYAAFPPIAAAAAAQAFGAVQAFAGGVSAAAGIAAFEKGGIVPATGLALVHQGETILPASLSGDGSGIGKGGFVFAPTIHALDAEGVDRVLTKHQRLFEQRVDKVLRKRGISGK